MKAKIRRANEEVSLVGMNERCEGFTSGIGGLV